METKEDCKIIQIIPASGVWSIWEEENGKRFCTEVDIIALIEERGQRYIQYMECDNFGEFEPIDVMFTNCLGFFHSKKKPTEKQLCSYGDD